MFIELRYQTKIWFSCPGDMCSVLSQRDKHTALTGLKKSQPNRLAVGMLPKTLHTLEI